MNYDILAFLAFIAVMSIILYKKKDKLSVQKILYPVVYMILYKTRLGIGFMTKASKKCRNLIITIAYCFVGFAFAGMFVISYSIFSTMIRFITAPITTDTGMSLLYPGTVIPGVGYLSFWYWLIGLFIVAVIHEMAHGTVAVAHKIKIKSSGFAVLGIIAPIFPAAFVEPDDKIMEKKDDIVQYSVLAAGPMINISVALILLLIFPYVADTTGAKLAPFEASITEPVGFSFDVPNITMPAYQAGLRNGTVISSFNSKSINDSNAFIENLYFCTKPGQEIILASKNTSYSIIATKSPVDENRAYIGIESIRNVREIKPEYKKSAPLFYWFKGFFKWLFLLNFFVGLSNLLPIFVTDGARMLHVALYKNMNDKKKAQKIWAVINGVFLGLIMLGLIATYIKRLF